MSDYQRQDDINHIPVSQRDAVLPAIYDRLRPHIGKRHGPCGDCDEQDLLHCLHDYLYDHWYGHGSDARLATHWLVCQPVRLDECRGLRHHVDGLATMEKMRDHLLHRGQQVQNLQVGASCETLANSLSPRMRAVRRTLFAFKHS